MSVPRRAYVHPKSDKNEGTNRPPRKTEGYTEGGQYKGGGGKPLSTDGVKQRSGPSREDIETQRISWDSFDLSRSHFKK